LVSSYPQLTSITRNPTTQDATRNAGVPTQAIDAYIQILMQLNASVELGRVVGRGLLSLAVADISYGPYDNGVFKGYVFASSEPSPMIDDLEHPSEAVATGGTAFHRIEDDWYLFEIWH
jgi:hypothetical protein